MHFWPNIAIFGPSLAVFGPKFLIFMEVGKSFGTHITEEPLRHLVRRSLQGLFRRLKRLCWLDGGDGLDGMVFIGRRLSKSTFAQNNSYN